MATAIDPQPLDRDATIAQQVQALVREGRTEEAAVHLHRQLEGRMLGYLRRHRLPADDAEEVVSDIWIHFLRTCHTVHVPAIAWLWTCAKHELVDWLRRRGALKRGGRGEDRLVVEVDDEVLASLIQTLESPQTPGWLKLCVERAAHQLECDDPNRAHVLWLSLTGHSAADIAIVYGASPPVTKQQEAAARNRVLEAKSKAKRYFAHCKD